MGISIEIYSYSHSLIHLTMKIKIISILTLLSIFSFQSHSKDLMSFPFSEAATVGIYIEDLRSGRVLASQNAKKAMTPASVTKSVTTAAAVMMLPEDFRFETKIMFVGDTSVVNGSINCDVVISASGDPTIESEHFPDNAGFTDSIVSAISRMGIRHIAGDIIFNNTVSVPDASPSWMIEDVAWDYGTKLHTFNYRDNRFTVTLPKWDSTPVTSIKIPQLTITNNLKPGDNDNIVITQNGNPYKLSLSGTLPDDARNYKIGCSLPEPNKIFIDELNSKLREFGISLSQNTVSNSKCDTVCIYIHRSPAKKDILRSLMVRSDNLFAEAMLNTLSPQGVGTDSLIAYFEHSGINCKTVSLYDGSGLSRVDRLSPAFLADIYRYMASSSFCDEYISTFPRSGIDGTLKSLLQDTRLHGRLALKTGSMGGVQCYGGYKLSKTGKPTHIVVIMVNNFFCKRSELRNAVNHLLLQIF